MIEPVLAVSYVDPNGLNIDAKTMYDFNLRNKATDYRSGQELHVDYAVGWGLGNGWVLGVGGYCCSRPRTTVRTVNESKTTRAGRWPSVLR